MRFLCLHGLGTNNQVRQRYSPAFFFIIVSCTVSSATSILSLSFVSLHLATANMNIRSLKCKRVSGRFTNTDWLEVLLTTISVRVWSGYTV